MNLKDDNGDFDNEGDLAFGKTTAAIWIGPVESIVKSSIQAHSWHIRRSVVGAVYDVGIYHGTHSASG